MNISGCPFAPTGGSATTITGVKSVSFDEQGEVLSEGADFDLFDTVSGVTKLAPSVTIETIDAMVGIMLLAAGATGALSFTVRDFRNGVVVTGGAKIFTIANAVLNPRKTSHEYRQLGKQTMLFSTFSSDGASNPVAVAAA